ncbi:MAG TPA: phosphate acetyltransferase [Syntrophobacteraceae bacterium]|nr:phosphate acetyltransferase [Syntrophobacteraceae bacterium]
MSRNLFITGMGPGSGKSAVVLGMMEMLARHGRKLGFFRPVVEGGANPDPLSALVKSRYPVVSTGEHMFGVDYRTARDLIAEESLEELYSRILEKYAALAGECDFVLCVGTDYRTVHTTLEFEFNVEVARNLGAPLVPVVVGQGRTVRQILDSVWVLVDSLEANNCDILSVFVNRVSPGDVTDVVNGFREDAPAAGFPLFVLPAHPLLDKPTVAEIRKALGAEMLHGDPARLDREVAHYKVAAMELPNFLDRLEEGSLVITPGDRSDILIGALAADAATSYPGIAGVVLTGGFGPAPQVLRLFKGLKRSPVPILDVKLDTFSTASRVSSIEASLTPENSRKIAGALGLFESNVDPALLDHRIDVMRSSRITPLMFQHDLLSRARSRRRHIVLPEGVEERVLRAAEILRLRDVADLTLLGNAVEVRDKITALGLSLGEVEIIDPAASELREEFGRTYYELRKHKGIPLQVALDAMNDVSCFGTMMVYRGIADGMVSGATHTTQHTIRPALEFIRTRPGCSIVSSVFFMCLPDRVLLYGDCAINPDPDAEQLAHIAVSSAMTAESFGIEPRVAMLSYSTGESGKGTNVDKIKEAARVARQLRPDIKLEGPIQYDAAIDPEVAKIKLPGSEVAGRATVFIFPDLNAGNNAYKAVQRAANAVAIGPVLQGLNKPVNDLSRGCTVADIVNTVAITAIQAQLEGDGS